MYQFLSDYSCLNSVLQTLNLAFTSALVSERCDQIIRGYFCNYVYPSCEPAQTNDTIVQPWGICQDNCVTYLLGGECRTQFASLANIGNAFGVFRFPLQCDNTLLFLSDLGLEAPLQQQNDSCVDISGKGSKLLQVVALAVFLP